MNEQLKIIISAEIDKLKKGVEDAQKHMKSFKDQVKDASKNVDGDIKKLGEGVKSGLKAVGTAVVAAGGALLALGASTAEYRNEQAKLATAFEAAGSNAETAKTTYDGLVRVLGDSGQATEAAAHLAKLSTEEKALSEWTNICQGVYATFGDSLPIEGLTEAANETAKVGTVTGSLADALNWAGISEDAFNEKLAACNTEAEREKLIRETLNGVYDDAAKKYEANNAQVLAQNEAQERLRETTAALGEAVAPVITAFTNFASQALAIVVPYIQQLAETYGPQLAETLTNVATALQEAFTWASQHRDLLMVVGGLIATVVVAIGLYNAVAAVKAAMTALELTSVWGLVSAYAAQAIAVAAAVAPYALIVAAIAGFIAIVVKAYKENETFRNIVDKVFNNIKDIISKVMEIVKSVISTVWTAIKLIWDNGLKQVLNLVITILAKVAESFTNKLNAVLTFVSGVIKAITNVIKSNLETAKTVVKNVIGLIKGIFTGDFGAAKQAVVNILNAILDNFKTKLNSAKTVVKSAIDAIKGFFNFKWSLPKLAMPHFTIKGKFSLNPPSVPKFDIDWYKLGGVFDKKTLFNYAGGIGGLGEDGAEAVVPLEKNTQWLDRIAEKLAAKQNGIPIVLQVDGKTFAQVSIDSINALTKQRGTLGLNLV